MDSPDLVFASSRLGVVDSRYWLWRFYESWGHGFGYVCVSLFSIWGSGLGVCGVHGYAYGT